MNIKLSALTKQFDDQMVLDHIDFDDDIHSLAIIGPSGGGKSTLLRILGGLIAPTSGEMLIGDQRVAFDEKSLQDYRRSIGFVFQQSGLFSHLSALKNITLPLEKVHGLSPEEAEQSAKHLLNRFGLSEDMHKRPAQLSGGQKQRVAIARAIAGKPKILLLDEPTSALDPEYTGEVLDIINELKNEGIDFVIVTHEMGFARHACDKVAFLSGGQLMSYGDSESLFEKPDNEVLSQFLSKLLEWRA